MIILLLTINFIGPNCTTYQSTSERVSAWYVVLTSVPITTPMAFLNMDIEVLSKITKSPISYLSTLTGCLLLSKDEFRRTNSRVLLHKRVLSYSRIHFSSLCGPNTLLLLYLGLQSLLGSPSIQPSGAKSRDLLSRNQLSTAPRRTINNYPNRNHKDHSHMRSKNHSGSAVA